MRIVLNGEATPVTSPEYWTLADVLRLELGLTGTNVGCEQGICGACTVIIDGLPARACLVPAGQVGGCEVATVEGLGTDAEPHPLQRAFSASRALQCGFCTSGFLMVAAGLMAEREAPTGRDVDDAVSSNLCRCTGYAGIRAAVGAVVDEAAGVSCSASPEGSSPW